MFRWTIYPAADEKIFYRQCKALEDKITGIHKGEQLQDVDLSLIQRYSIGTAKIEVLNDHYVGIVEVRSDIDLSPYFKD